MIKIELRNEIMFSYTVFHCSEGLIHKNMEDI